MLPRRVVIPLTALVAVLFWRRAAKRREHVDALYDDGSLLRLERGVEADDLLDDAHELLAILA